MHAPIGLRGTIPAHNEADEYTVFTTEYDRVLSADEHFLDNHDRRQDEDRPTSDKLRSDIIKSTSELFSSLPVDDTAELLKLGDIAKSDKKRVTFAVDLSGSGRATSVQQLSTLYGVIKCLDLAGIESDVFGFTTQRWKGGKSFQDLKQMRCSAQSISQEAYLESFSFAAGRTSDVVYVNLKSPEQCAEALVESSVAFLGTACRKEDIPGEALVHALNRLSITSSKTDNSIIFLSDGSVGNDDVTEKSCGNNPSILLDHLRSMLEYTGNNTNIGVAAMHLLGAKYDNPLTGRSWDPQGNDWETWFDKVGTVIPESFVHVDRNSTPDQYFAKAVIETLGLVDQTLGTEMVSFQELLVNGFEKNVLKSIDQSVLRAREQLAASIEADFSKLGFSLE